MKLKKFWTYSGQECKEYNVDKLLVRAEILSVISNFQSGKISNEAKITETLENLKKIADIDFVFQVFIKELCKTEDENRLGIISFLLSAVVPVEIINDSVFKLLETDEISDIQKYKLIKILRNIGVNIDYETIIEYLDEPDSVINEDTKLLLENSFHNPELQIDFIDFFSAISENDGELLLSSLVEDYPENMLAGLLIPMLYAMLDMKNIEKIIEILGDTKSIKALHALQRIAPAHKTNETLYAKIKKNISKLKLSTSNKNEGPEPVIKGTKFFKAFASVPDGWGNMGIVFARQRIDSTIQIFATVINLNGSIVDCFGFNEISQYEFEKIIEKFYEQQQQFEIPPEVAKLLLDMAENSSVMNRTKISYEYICWKPMLSDIELADEKKVFSSIQSSQNSKIDIKILYEEAPEIRTWFFDQTNTGFCTLFEELIKIHKDVEIVDGEFINKIAQKYFDEIFNDEELLVFDKKLQVSAYLYNSIGKMDVAQTLLLLLPSSDEKTKFMLNMIYKSIFLYFIRLQERKIQEKSASNIFKAKQNQSSLFNESFVDKMVSLYELEEGENA